MALETNIKGVRDYIAGKVSSTWTDVNFSHEDPEMVNAPPFALIILEGATMEPQSMNTDAVLLSFTVVGRWVQTGSASSAKIEKTSQLRAALLADHTAGGFGHLPMVTEFLFDQTEVLDGHYEAGLRYQVMVTADR